MKHLRLLIAAIAAMTSLSMSAQTWTASEVGAGDFYLYNVGKSQFLTRGNGWGTQASVSPNSALTVTLEEYNGAYKLRTDANGTGKGLERLGDPVIYTDQSANKNSTWTFTKVDDASNGPVYTIVSKDNHGGGAGSYMTASADNTIVGPADAVTNEYGQWQLLQAWIKNSVPVNDANGWTTSQTPTFDGSNVCAEFWNKSGASIKQTVSNLPAGSYELIAVALTRTGMTATLNAGNNTMNIATASQAEANNCTQANAWFNNGNGVNRLEFTHGGGNLEIGLTADNTTGDHWLVWRSFVLIYKGLDLSEFAATLASAVAAAEAVEGTIPTAAYSALAAVVTENNKTYTTTDEYTAATNAIVEATNAAKALQANYTRYNTVKTAALGIAANLDTTTPDAAFDAATTNDAIESAIASLRATFLAGLPNVTIPETTGYIDVTAVMVDNASVRQNTDYWTSYMYPSSPNGGSFGKCANEECEFYQQNFKFYQTLTLSAGTWEFGVTGFHRAGNHSTYFFAGDDKILIPGVASSVVNTMAAAQEYFDNGNGKVALKFLVETAQDIEIGIDNQDTETDKWTIFRDFTLKYYGAPDYSVYDQQWAETVQAANTAISENPSVTGDELTAVNAAINDAPDGSNKANYLEKIQALEAATNTLVAAAPSYNYYVAEVGRAALVGVTPETTPTSAADAVTAAHALQVDEYTAVSTDYQYDMTGVIGDFGTWTGTATVAGEPDYPNYLDKEHWSGTTHAYYEQASTGWDNARGWTIKYEKTAKLPAGDYLLKVAARASGDVAGTVTCTATDAVVVLPTEGAFTRGIALNGEAKWEGENTEFARNGEGYGWQWRYLPFSLTEETTVTMRFYAETSKQYNWMSIADGQLLAKQEFEKTINISDNDTQAPEAGVVTEVVTDRKLFAGANTIVLPFDATAEEIGATNVLAYQGTELGEDDVLRIKFKNVEEVNGKVNLVANTPYIVFVAKDQENALVFTGARSIASVEAPAVNDNNGQFDFVGTYTAFAKDNTVITGNDYIMSAAGNFKKAAGGNALKAYRAYLKNVGGEPVNVKFDIDGQEATGIEAVQLYEAVFGNDAIYNLNGQRVNKAQKGVFIVNGKKVVIK